MSLIERKKQQWAREREELAGLCAPWGAVREINFGDQFARNRQLPNTSSNNSSAYARKDSGITPRRSSLPPLYKNQYNSTDRYEREKDFGGETSGYGSDNPNIAECPKTANPNWHQNGYESSSSYREDRPRWGDRGVAVGNKFWGSRENLNIGKVATNDPPGWLKRGLEGDTQIVVANSSPAESPQQDCGESERPSTSSSNNPNRTHIRGQNAPIDHLEIMERERRRQTALAHQEAIRKQLEEREQRRKEEKERRIKEEREEELRIEKEQEMERKRREQEMKALQDKQERERKRKEAIQEAIEIAEKEAKIEKMRLKLNKQNNINLTECIVEKDKVPSPRDECNNNTAKINNRNDTSDEANSNSIKAKMNNLDKENCSSTSSKIQDKNHIKEDETTCQKVVTPRELKNERDKFGKNNNEDKNNDSDFKLVSPRDCAKNENDNNNCNHGNHNYNNNNNSHNVINHTVFTPQLTPRIENVALLFQSSTESYQNMQYALLVPNINPTTHTAIPIAVPIPITTDRDLYTARTENRILTPTSLRNARTFCDSSTQTDYVDFGRLDTSDVNRGRFVTDKMSSLDLNYDTNRSRNKDRRSSRNEDRSREERPKWGANRPPTRYMKQSEKDPLYQRRKLRQKMRENKTYEDKNSSDESQMASPRTYRKKTYVEKRHTRALWRKNDQIFGRDNMKMYQTEIIPLEADKDQIYYKQSCDRDCCCHCRCSRRRQEPKVDILKIEHSSPRENARPDLLPPDFNDNDNTFVDTSEPFSSLNNDLISQEQWENTPVRSPNLSGSIRYSHENL